MPIPRWEILLGQVLGTLVGLALIAIGLGMWTKDPGPTVTSTTVVTVTGAKHLHEKTTTTTLNGPAADLATAKSPDAVPRRDAAVTVGLVASGALLLLGSSWLPRLRALTVPPKPAAQDPGGESDGDGDGDES